MSAVRLARAATRRDRVLKFAGCYHGHADALLAAPARGSPRSGSRPVRACPLRQPPTPSSARTTTSKRRPRRSVRYGEGLACVLVEPVAGNMGVVPPEPGFLEALRGLCDASGSLLVFDEVITGFRVGRGALRSATALRLT